MSKVKITDRKLLNQIYSIVGLVGSLASIVALLITLPGWWKLMSVIIAIIIFGSVFVICYRASHKRKATFKINQIEVNVVEGDIFKTDASSINVIPFNDYYDVVVDNKIIAENSLHGKYIKKFWSGREDELNNIIKNDVILCKYKSGERINRNFGNQQKYELGSVICIGNFVLTALSHFDEKNQAYLSFSNYIDFLASFWDHLDEVYANRTINIPVFGSGITRIGKKRQSMQRLLELILWSIKESDFQGKRINILIYKDDINLVDFYHLEPSIY